MKDEIKEIKLEKRKPTFDYILNDLALDSLMFRVVNGIGSSQDKFDFDYQVKLMQKEISRLRKNIHNAIEYIKSPRWKIDTHIEFNKQHLLNILEKGE